MPPNLSHSSIGNSTSRLSDGKREEGSVTSDDRVASVSRMHRGRRNFVKRAIVISYSGILAAALLVTGCSAPAAAGPRKGASAPRAETPSVYQRLIKGMRRAEVANYLGKPAEIKSFTTEGAAGEIWKYSKVFPGPTRQVSTEMRDIETVDPITGVMSMRKEPVYRNEMTTITEIAELLFIKDLLVEWKQQRFADRQLY